MARFAEYPLLRSRAPIEWAALVYSLTALSVSVWLLARGGMNDMVAFPEVLHFCYLSIAACILGMFSTKKVVHFSVFVCILALIMALVFSFMSGRFAFVELILASILIFNIALRLSHRAAMVVSVVLVSVLHGAGYSAPGFAGDRITVLVAELVLAFFSITFIYFREKLVEQTGVIEQQQASIENLAAATRSFVTYLEDVEEESAERERLRITRELHDSIGYAMTNISMMMNASRYIIESEPGKVAEFCAKTKQLATNTLDETRRTLYELREIQKLQQQDPVIFFTNLCTDFQKATGTTVECHPGNLPRAMDERAFSTLYRIVQVAFINALRHGNAATIRLFFWLRDDDLSMTIWNDVQNRLMNGSIREGIGLRGVGERLAQLHGTLSVDLVPDGFQLQVTIPHRELGMNHD